MRRRKTIIFIMKQSDELVFRIAWLAMHAGTEGGNIERDSGGNVAPIFGAHATSGPHSSPIGDARIM